MEEWALQHRELAAPITASAQEMGYLAGGSRHENRTTQASVSHNQPELPANVELSPTEIQALLLMMQKYGKRTEHITDDMMPTIAQATEWIARLGGYMGKSSGGPPGSITIGRGLEYLRAVTDGVEADLSRRTKTASANRATSKNLGKPKRSHQC